MSESTIDAAVLRAMLREERRMNDWTLPDPQETLVDKIPTEDKLLISHEDSLWYDIDGDPIEWREMAPEERLLLYIQIIDMVPEEQRTEEVRDAISEAIFETERILCEPR